MELSRPALAPPLRSRAETGRSGIRGRHVLAAAVVAGAAVGLAACSARAPQEMQLESPIPRGSILVLERTLEVAPGESRVYLQDGQVVRPGLLAGTARFRPRCWFTLDPPASGPAIEAIRPDRFETGPMQRSVQGAREPAPEMRVAASVLTGLPLAAREGGGGPGFLTHELALPLYSERQPNVSGLRCQVDHRVGVSREIGLPSVEQALGDLARIEPAD